ncbi:unnamed protein product [marine sediment metagenome]|uniref:Uncharacterized protein n=1 Tax=marine sediment metagenome TaxID=412755 RepID=X1PYP3_9ZZZZ
MIEELSVVPLEALSGETVTVKVTVRNIYREPHIPMWVGGYYGSNLLTFSPDGIDEVPYNGTGIFTASFTMPDFSLQVAIWSYHFDFTISDWVLDDYDHVEVALAGVPEPYKGTISKMELEYNETRGDIPVSDVPQNKRGLVHIWGRNDMSTSQKLGISWVVRDPDGIVVEEYSDWEFGTTGPDDDHHFIGGRFNLDKVGTYTLLAYLVMNFDDPLFVDIYDGDLCTVAAAVPEPVEGTIIRKELEYSGSGDGTVPVIGVPQGVRAKLHVWGRNDMSISQGMGIYWFVADPEGFVAEEYSDWGGTIGPYPTDHEFISSGQFDLNKVGKYTFWIELLMGAKDDPEMVDLDIGELCTVAAAVPEPEFRGFGITEYVKR